MVGFLGDFEREKPFVTDLEVFLVGWFYLAKGNRTRRLFFLMELLRIFLGEVRAWCGVLFTCFIEGGERRFFWLNLPTHF